MSSTTSLPFPSDGPDDRWSPAINTNPLFPSEAVDPMMHLYCLLNTLKTPGVLHLRHILRHEPDIPTKQVRFLISIISHEQIPQLYPSVIGLPTPEMSNIIHDFSHAFGMEAKRFLAITCSESLLSILEKRKDILLQISMEFDRLVPWRAALFKEREKLIDQKGFEGLKKAKWEEQWALYETDLQDFVGFHNKLAAEAKELEGCEKHVRRAETLAMRALGEEGDTRSGRM